jgi:hypothetical protein
MFKITSRALTYRDGHFKYCFPPSPLGSDIISKSKIRYRCCVIERFLFWFYFLPARKPYEFLALDVLHQTIISLYSGCIALFLLLLLHIRLPSCSPPSIPIVRYLSPIPISVMSFSTSPFLLALVLPLGRSCCKVA